jgi:transaldolase
MEHCSLLDIKLFADGADKFGILKMYRNPIIKGFTTNPTLMRKAGVKNYKAFCLDILEMISDRPFSFEVFSDDFTEMYDQALEIASWAENIYVKIPITNTKGESSIELIHKLVSRNIKLNVTALMTLNQVRCVVNELQHSTSSYVSVFAGRIADTGRDPMPIMRQALEIMKPFPQLELIWASPRELLNIFQANSMGCHIITATNDILDKLSLVGKDLEEFSLETVQMFYHDAVASNFTLESHEMEAV